MKVKILGCGSSAGVPILCKGWGKCDPTNPKNRRRRSGILVQTNGKNLLIDAPPEVKDILWESNIERIDAVLYTHPHSDHIFGTNDLCAFSWKMKKSIDIYADKQTLYVLHQAFGYGFRPLTLHNSGNLHLNPHLIQAFEPFEVLGIKVFPMLQPHGYTTSLGFRIGDFSYNTDISQMTPEVCDALQGVKTLILDCKGRNHRIDNHLYLDKALSFIEQIQPEKVYLTHMSIEMDYDTLCRELPENIRPVYDGMDIDVPHEP